MNCWEVLGLSPTNDKKAIKLAYAKLLKHNKPDENPEGFSQLHMAYKQSLQRANTITPAVQLEGKDDPDESLPKEPPAIKPLDVVAPQAPVPVKPEEQLRIDKGLPVESEPVTHERDQQIITAQVADIENYEQVVDAENENRMEQLRRAWQMMSEQAGVALHSLETRDDKQAWEFLENNEALYDIEFKVDFSEHIFAMLLEFFEQKNIDLNKRKSVLRYLNSIFKWTDYTHTLEYNFGYEQTEPLLNFLSENEGESEKPLTFTCPKTHVGPMEYGNYYKRLAAGFIDGLLCVLVSTSLDSDVDTMLGMFLIYYLLILPIMESTPLQGTPGKILFGLKVTSIKGKRLNIFHSLWRALLFTIATLAIKITVWINFFLGNRLLHDRLSYSIVINR